MVVTRRSRSVTSGTTARRYCRRLTATPLATGNNPCCTIDGTVIHDEIVPLIKQVAQEKQLPIIDLNTPTTGRPEYFGDGVHPTAAAYAIVAGLVHDALLATSSSGTAGSGNASGSGGSSGRTSGVGGAGSAGANSASASSAGASPVTSSAGASNGGRGSVGAGVPGFAGSNSAGAAPVPPTKSGGGGCAVSRGGADRGVFVWAALLGLSWVGCAAAGAMC